MSSLREMTNQIYDTLMGNVGLSKYHTAFQVADVVVSETDENGTITFTTDDGTMWQITIEKLLWSTDDPVARPYKTDDF